MKEALSLQHHMASKTEKKRGKRDVTGRNSTWKEKERSPSSSKRRNSSSKRRPTNSKTTPTRNKKNQKNRSRSSNCTSGPWSNTSGTWSISNTNGHRKNLCTKKAKKGLSSATYSQDPANIPRSSQDTSDSSDFFSDLSALNKARAKSRTQEEKESLMSVITSQLPSLLHRLTSPDSPKTSADENFIQFMKYLEEQKISDSLQDVAETAISKLLGLVGKEKISLGQNRDPHIEKVLESQPAGALATEVSDKSAASEKSGQEVSYVNTSGATDKHYSEFLRLLEEKKIFVALQNVVDEAVHRLFEAMKEEEADSVMNTASQPEKNKRQASTKKKT